MAEQRKKAAKAAKIAKDKMACNKPQKTPGHPTKSHVVKACEGGEEKIIRFGQQGVEGAGKNPTTAKDKARKKSYYARHNAQDSNPDKMSARYWSHTKLSGDLFAKLRGPILSPWQNPSPAHYKLNPSLKKQIGQGRSKRTKLKHGQ
jgi:hypothetical protein